MATGNYNNANKSSETMVAQTVFREGHGGSGDHFKDGGLDGMTGNFFNKPTDEQARQSNLAMSEQLNRNYGCGTVTVTEGVSPVVQKGGRAAS